MMMMMMVHYCALVLYTLVRCQWLFCVKQKPKETWNQAIKEEKNTPVKRKKGKRKKGQKWGSETYVNDDHLYVADDEDSVFVGLRDVDVAICHSDGSSPAAVDALGAANVVLHTHTHRARYDITSTE